MSIELPRDVEPKLKPVPADRHLDYADWYRGNKLVTWELRTHKGRVFEYFATRCARCGIWWGWTIDLAKILRLRRAMRKLGCPRCRKKK